MASSLFNLYKTILPPSTVECCARARLTGPTATNLVVAKGSVLEIYVVVEEEVALFSSGSSNGSNGGDGAVKAADADAESDVDMNLGENGGDDGVDNVRL